MGVESPKPASTPTGAVFLSYASQDAAAARNICASLQAAGIEVWFDQSELRGGDAWDESIRDQIKACALFIPVISANAHARLEGYFRLEWKLAIDRSHRIASKQPFLLPVVIDDTQQADDAIPERFRDLQWTRLLGGQATPAFVERVRRLLSSEPSHGATSTRPEAITGSGAVPAMSEPVRSSWRSQPALLATSALLAVGLTYFLVDKAWLSKRPASSAVTTTTSARSQTPSAVPEKSIAVLPFVDMSEKHDQEYFSDGMAEQILDLLASIPGLRVIGRTSSFQFRGKSLDVRAIGSQLQAAYLLEGSVRRSNDQVRVTAQLLSTLDGTHSWSNTYNAGVDDVLKVQDSIAAGIARALELTIAGAGRDRATMTGEASDIYMRGLHALDTSSREGCTQAIGFFGQLLRLQPDSERALISLARAHECLGYQDWSSPDAGFEKAREFALRALRVNPNSADAHVTLASVHIMHDYDWTAARQEIEEAAKLAYPDARALTVAARLSVAQGQFDHAIELLNQAITSDPLDPLIFDILGDTYFRLRQYDKSEAMYKRCLQIQGGYGIEHYYVSNAILMQGRLEEALMEANKGSPGDGGYEAGRALIFRAMGRSREADAALGELINVAGKDWASEIARVYAYRAERDQAFAWLDRAYQQRETDLYYMKGDPLLENLHGDPRFQAFLHRMNLTE